MGTKVQLTKDFIGISLSALIIASWIGHLLYCLTVHSSSGFSLLNIWLQSFLTTGLFIVTHDSIHGTLSPHHKRTNRLFGVVSIFLYAGFSYEKLKKNHFKHHEKPASEFDPDYTSGSNENFFRWLSNFVKNYFGLKEFAIMHIHVGTVYWIGGSIPKLFLFYAIPAWLSALQLFYFGTYLPHRGFAGDEGLKTRSNSFPTWLSLLTCYHFGYHKEHHLYPSNAWWQLPRTRRKTLETNR